MARAGAIAALRERIGCIEHGRRGEAGGALATGWDAIDACLPGGGLRRGAVHEWLLQSGGSRGWSAPLLALAHLARRAVDAYEEARCVCWIGRAVWPYGSALATESDRGLLDRSLFLDPATDVDRLWAIDLALQSDAVAAVVADGSRLIHKATRRLQLAAEAGDTIGLLARPPNDRRQLSAAATRWIVTPLPSDGFAPRWSVELVRCKGSQPQAHQRRWILELCNAGRLGVSSHVADRSDAPTNGADVAERDSARAARWSA